VVIVPVLTIFPIILTSASRDLRFHTPSWVREQIEHEATMHSSLSARRAARPSIESLEDRDVPSTVNLTTRGTSGIVNEAIFQQADPQPTGSGVIQSFVRLQGTGIEQGYNTDARSLQFDENKSPVFTRSLRLNDVPIVIVDGVAYRQFMLDINQKASAPLLSLDELKIYLGDRGDLRGYDAGTGKLAGLDAIYNLDAGGNNSVLMNYSLNHGSGSGDMAVLIPDRFFTAQSSNPFVYLYSKFGDTAGAGANAGFEEWSVLPKTNVSNLGSLSGSVYFDASGDGVRSSDEAGIAGVYITLSGIDDQGHTVFLTTVTDDFGNYRFLNLRPGTYSITESQPNEYLDGAETLGSLGGEVGYDSFTNIHLLANVAGIGYDFGELLSDDGGFGS
jgi:hypothetical protein